MKIVQVIICVILFPPVLFSQNYFQKKYGNSYIVSNVQEMKLSKKSIDVLYSIGKCFNGSTPYSAGIGMLSLDFNGNIIDQFNYSSSTCDSGWSAINFQNISNNRYAITSFFGSGPLSETAIVITDTANSFALGKIFYFNGISVLKRVKQNKVDNCFYAIGTIDSLFTSHITNAALLIKTDSLLNPIWSKIISTDFDPGFADLDFYPDGSLIIAGYCSDSLLLNTYLLTLRMDTNGGLISSKKYEAFKFAFATNVKYCDNGLTICGSAKDTISGGGSMLLLRLDTSGNILWSNRYLYSGSIQTNMIYTKDHGYLLSGTYYDNGLTVMAVIKTDSSGNILWNYIYNETAWNQQYFHCEDSTGAFISLSKAYHSPPTGPAETYLLVIRSDLNGVSGCSESTFPVSKVTYNNFSISNQPLVINDYLPNTALVTLQRNATALIVDTICVTNEVNEISFQDLPDLLLFPNPVHDQLNIKFDSDVYSTVEYFISDIAGKVLYESQRIKINKTYLGEISLSSLSKGYYLLTFKLGDRFISKKVFKD